MLEWLYWVSVVAVGMLLAFPCGGVIYDEMRDWYSGYKYRRRRRGEEAIAAKKRGTPKSG